MILDQMGEQPCSHQSQQKRHSITSKTVTYITNKTYTNETNLLQSTDRISTLTEPHIFNKTKKMKVQIDGVEIKSSIQDYEGKKVEFLALPKSHIYTWSLLKPLLKHQKSRISGRTPTALEVGCGSGLFSILLAKKLGYGVTAIDKNGDAIRLCKKNAQANDTELQEIKHQYYGPYSFPNNAADLIVLSPPFLIYPQERQASIPGYARSGKLGLSEFYNQLESAAFHLADSGMMVFFTIQGGDEVNPRILTRIKEKGLHASFKPFVEPIASEKFLEDLWGNQYLPFQKEYVKNYSHIHFGLGVVRKHSFYLPKWEEYSPELTREGWDSIIKIHKKTFFS